MGECNMGSIGWLSSIVAYSASRLFDGVLMSDKRFSKTLRLLMTLLTVPTVLLLVFGVGLLLLQGSRAQWPTFAETRDEPLPAYEPPPPPPVMDRSAGAATDENEARNQMRGLLQTLGLGPESSAQDFQGVLQHVGAIVQECTVHQLDVKELAGMWQLAEYSLNARGAVVRLHFKNDKLGHLGGELRPEGQEARPLNLTQFDPQNFPGLLFGVHTDPKTKDGCFSTVAIVAHKYHRYFVSVFSDGTEQGSDYAVYVRVHSKKKKDPAKKGVKKITAEEKEETKVALKCFDKLTPDVPPDQRAEMPLFSVL